jgi:hypothetical protein
MCLAFIWGGIGWFEPFGLPKQVHNMSRQVAAISSRTGMSPDAVLNMPTDMRELLLDELMKNEERHAKAESSKFQAFFKALKKLLGG